MFPVPILIQPYYDPNDRAFRDFANERIEEINTHISAYKKETNPEEKLAILKTINTLRKNLENAYPEDFNLPEFNQQILIGLFNQCKEAFASLGKSMHEIDDDAPAELRNAPITQLLANLEPETLAEMLEILDFERTQQNKDTPPMQIIRKKRLEFVAKHPACRSVFETYQMDYRGGANAKNYQLTSIDPDNPHTVILRVDARLGGAKEADAALRASPIKDILTPVAAARTMSFANDSKKKTLLITTVCEGGSPLDHAKRHSRAPDRIKGALDLYHQMAKIFVDIAQQGYLLPDGKNLNFLIDREGKLRIADTKSIIFADQGEYDYYKTLEKNRWNYGQSHSLLATPEATPPELKNIRSPQDGSWIPASFSVDKMHSFILGQNLYQYLTGCDTNALIKQRHKQDDPIIPITNGADLNFQAGIFQSAEGEQMKTLICNLIQKDPANRISPQRAMETIEVIQLIQKLSELRLSNGIEFDPELKSHIKLLHTRLQKAQTSHNPDELSKLKKELEKTVQENETMVNFLRAGIQKIEGSSLQEGKKEKIAAIKIAYASVPVAERGAIMETEEPSEAVKDVRSALGIARRFFNYRPMFSSQSAVFQKYKTMYNEQKNAKDTQTTSEEAQTPTTQYMNRTK